MDTDYDRIAEQYKRAKLQPWRTHIERYTLLRLLGDVRGKSVIDLACGEGHYTRELRRQGASRVVGVDLSHGMIGLAKAEEAREPLGIEYLVENVETLQLAEQYDVVFAAYLLNYAHTAEELTQMCRSVARLLKPGGRFLTVNNNPVEPPANFAAGRAYGYSKRIEGELIEGAPVIWQFSAGKPWKRPSARRACTTCAGTRRRCRPKGCENLARDTGRLFSPALRWLSSVPAKGIHGIERHLASCFRHVLCG